MPPIKPGDFRPKHALGHIKGAGMADNGFPEGVHIGILIRVDETTMKGDIRVLTRGGTTISEIDLTQAMAGPRSFWGGVPEENSLVVVAYRKRQKQIWEPMILGFLPQGNKSGLRFDPFSPTDPKNVPKSPSEKSVYKQWIGRASRRKKLLLKPGNVGGMSSDGAELVLAKDLRMCNRAGDLIELRDAERTLVTQAIHRFDSASGVKSWTGPVRRSEQFLPQDIFSSGRTLKTEKDRYFGTDELKALGPGAPGSNTKYSNASGVVLDFINDTTTYPPTTYSNGKRVFYPSTVYATSIEAGEAGGGAAFTEERLEMAHDTDLVQEVLNEIDGFSIVKRRPFIERVYGTVIGNDTTGTDGIRTYGKVLRPVLWPNFLTEGRGTFNMSEVERAAKGDTDTLAAAAAFLFRIWSPFGAEDNNPFSLAIEKQGKVYLHVPKPTVERYPDDTGVSVEANLMGALKMYIGASNKNTTSIHATLAGGIVGDIGRNKDTGNSLDLTYHGSVTTTFKAAVGNESGYAKFDNIQGSAALGCSGDYMESIQGAKNLTVNGGYVIQADRVSLNAFQGLSMNLGGLDVMVAQKTQYNYALVVLETIVAGGKVTTVLAGGLIESIVAGGKSTTVVAGGITETVAAGGYAVSVGAGGMTMSVAAGAVAISAAAGAISITGGLAVSITSLGGMALTATGAIIMTSPAIFLGGPTAVLGVVRGLPTLPPGTPTLDQITGLALLGALTVFSN